MKQRKAFTLIEVLIVICVISVLFIVLASRVDFATDKARLAGVHNDFKSIEAAVHTVALEQGEIVRNNQQLIILLNNKLDQELQVIEQNGELFSSMQDPWGSQYKLSYTTPSQSKGCMFIQSAGPDTKFDTDDDVISSITYSTASGKDDIIVDQIDNATKNDMINNAEHVCIFNQQNENSFYLAVDATCKNPASYYYSCTCGKKNGVTFSVPGSQKSHDFSARVETSQYLKSTATCQTPSVYYKSCVFCGLASSEEFVSSTLGNHDEIFAGEQNVHTKCAVCNAVVNTSHVFNTEVVQEATCDFDGLTVTSCECGYSYDTIVPAGGHTQVFVGEENVHSKCTTCEQMIVSEHTFTETIVTNVSCTNDGWIQYNCECGYSKGEAVKSTGHIAGPEATCMDAQKCTKCNTILNPIIEHVPTGTVTCTTAQTCSMCNTVLFAATGHQNTEIRNLQQATPSSSGYTGDTYCIDCNTKISNGKTYSLSPGLYESGSSYTKLIKSWSGMRSAGWLDKDYIVVSSYRNNIAGDLYINTSTLKWNAFANCTKLTNVYLGPSVTSVYAGSFTGCTGLQTFKATNLTSLYTSMFEGCTSLTTVDAPKVVSISADAFNGCSKLATVSFGAVTDIGSEAFYGCTSLQSLPSEVFDSAKIGTGAFSGCTELSSVDFSKISTINTDAFSDCTKLTEANLSHVTSIGDSAFEGCVNLKNVVVGRGLTKLGDNVFKDCDSLNTNLKDSIYYLGDGADDLYIIAIKVSSKTKTNYVLDANVMHLNSDLFNGCNKMTTLEIPETLTTIGRNAFYNCSALKTMYIPENVTRIGYGAFFYCDGITSIGPHGSGCDIELPIRNEWGWWFNYCDGLTTVIVPEGVKTLTRTFQSSKALKNVTLPDSLTSFSYAFDSCTGIKSIGPRGSGAQVELPAGITEISNSAFSMCHLTSIIFPETLTRLDSFSIHYNDLTTYVFPESLQYIGDYSIGDNSKLKTMYIGSNLKSIGKYAFRSLSGLTHVYYDGTMEQWNAISKGTDWNIWCNQFTVVCTDGNIIVPANQK